MKSLKIRGLMALMVLVSLSGWAGTTRALMRFPDVHGDQVVFVHGGDIWRAPMSGGTAVRLTVHDGDEIFPKFSPDGQLIAFTGQYDGNSDVYVMNMDGGDIFRVTYHPGTDTVVGWHPTQNKILFSSSRGSFGRTTQLYLIAPDGTGLEALPIHEISQGSFSPDGKQIAYNKVAREHRTWKRYVGGLAQDIYLYNFETKQNSRLTDFPGTDRIPMWVGDSVYFASDRDGVLNIYSLDPATREVKQLTQHKDYDARRPSAGTGKIVYELGGSLWALDIASGQTAQIPITINTDDRETRPYLKNVQDFISSVSPAPNGKSVLVIARGEIFTVPKENGAIRDLTNTSGARELEATWSPDGKKVAYLSDQSGEYEVYVAEMGPSWNPQKLTTHTSGYRHHLTWSPDGQKLAYTDQTLTLWVLDLKTKKEQKIDRAEFENIDVSQNLKPISDFAWSPDSQFIAYGKMNADLVYHLYIVSVASGEIHDVSQGLFNDFNPTWTPDGQHLVFVSNRRFNPTFDDFEWELVYKKAAGIYALTLRKDGPALLPLKDDLNPSEEAKKPEKVLVRIDFDGLADRIEALPLPASNYRNLVATESALFYLDREEGDFNRFEFRVPEDMDLHAFDWASREAGDVIKGINQYTLTPDGQTIAYRKGNDVGLIAASARDPKGQNLALGKLQMWIDPRQEWQQIFNDAWRLERDYYYEPNMHGLDWNRMREKYSPLIQVASCRQDLTYVIGELIGELNTSHTYVYGGDTQLHADRVNIGMLGVDWKTSADGKYYAFGHIYTTPNWSAEMVPPLAGPGKDVQVGDLLLQVNGQPVTPQKNIYSYFQNLAGVQVTLTIGKAGNPATTRQVQVVPASNEYEMRYQAWVEHNRAVVDQASNGQIGYVHLPDTFLDSAVEFPKSFFALARKKGIVVDGRFNGGGLDPEIFLKRLNRKPHSYWTRRYSHDQTSPVYAPNAHMVCLTNRQAGSGGDELPEEFRRFGMGPVIGTRSWGGLVGVSMFLQLMDGGGLTAPDYRIYEEAGNWIVENEGVTPDIEVDLDPAEMQRGYDAQLQKGIEVLMKQIADEPRVWPSHPPFPAQKLQ